MDRIETNIYDKSETYYPCTVFIAAGTDGFIWRCNGSFGFEGGMKTDPVDFAELNITVLCDCTVEVLTNSITGERSAGWKRGTIREDSQ